MSDDDARSRPPAAPTSARTPVGSAGFGPVFSAACARATADELEEWQGFALKLCEEADAIALRHFRRDLEIATKPDRSYVTQADTGIERHLRERIRARFPDHGFVGEEYGEEAGRSSSRWYIDPIDGTHNYIRGVPLFGTLLALEIEGELQIGVLSAPALRERWYAARGLGAWAIGAAGMEGPRRIAVSRVADPVDAQVVYGSSTELDAHPGAPGFRGLLREVWRERGFGDFWGYALVAEGAAEAMIEVDAKTWDLAAPLVIIEEAGGRLTDFAGRRRIDGLETVASNGLVHDRILERLARPG